MVNFDEHAQTYRKSLGHGLMPFGQKDTFFDLYKLNCLKGLITDDRPYDIMDYGCGVGKLTTILAKEFRKCQVYGYDVSLESMRVAEKESAGLKNILFFMEPPQEKKYDFIIVANVFHHVEPNERKELFLKIKNLLKPNGKIVIFEHNPLNPATRYIVSKCPFDVDAKIIFRHNLIELAKSCNLKIEIKKYILFFPWSSNIFRKLEELFKFLPLGAQYMLVLAQ